MVEEKLVVHGKITVAPNKKAEAMTTDTSGNHECLDTSQLHTGQLIVRHIVGLATVFLTSALLTLLRQKGFLTHCL
jgi:hypothetical protein